MAEKHNRPNRSSKARTSALNVLGGLLAGLAGLGFFSAIMGVFGMRIAIGALLLFIAVASLVIRRSRA